MIIDTSAWIDFLRDPNSAVGSSVGQVLRDGDPMTTDVIRLELLAGAATESVATALRDALDGCEVVDQRPLVDVEAAASLFRSCRRAGETVRSPNDCLVAAIAIRTRLPVLHNDRDFDALARHTPLLAVRT